MPKQASRWIWSALAVSASLLLVLTIAEWHANATYNRRVSNRFLEAIENAPDIDDDITRDETCREYIMKFLNGTTDAKDECQAMYNAWQAADCRDDTKNDILGRKHQTEDGNWTDDDVIIDDFYENWECCSSISAYYNKHCEEAHLDAMRLFGIVSVLVVCGVMKSLIRVAGVQWIPDAGACIIVGAIVGGILRFFGPNVVDARLTFDNDLFLQVMLPPIVFEAALSIDKRAFRRDLFPILTFALFGTAFSAVAIGYITYSLSSIGRGMSLPLLDSLIFGALMSSIDPVATLSILSSVGVSQGDTLYTLIFGESLLNDGVSIVLFDSLVRHMGDAAVVDRATIQDTLYHFVVVSAGSIMIGLLCGALCTLYFWALRGKHTAVSEVALFFTWALVPYYIADGLGYSGIIGIMVMGFMLDYYVVGGFQSDDSEWNDYMQLRCDDEGVHPVEPSFERMRAACVKAFSGRGHILSRSQHHVGFVAEVISSIMETAIFAYLGLFLFNDTDWTFKLTSTGIFACISSRAVMVIVFAALINLCVWIDLETMLTRLWNVFFRRGSNVNDDDSYSSDTKVYLDKKTQMILFSAGIRGAVSYALVQNIPVYDAVSKHGSHYKGELKAMTSAAIVLILFAFGAMTYFTVQRDLSPDRERVAGPLTHRLMSMPLASDDENEDSSDLNSLSLEIEGRPSLGRPNSR